MSIDDMLMMFNVSAELAKVSLKSMLDVITEGKVPADYDIRQLYNSVDDMRGKYNALYSKAKKEVPVDDMPKDGAPIKEYYEAIRNSEAVAYERKLEETKAILKQFVSVQSSVINYAKALQPFQHEAENIISELDNKVLQTEEFEEKIAGAKLFLKAINCKDLDSDEGMDLLDRLADYYTSRIQNGLAAGKYFIPIKTDNEDVVNNSETKKPCEISTPDEKDSVEVDTEDHTQEECNKGSKILTLRDQCPVCKTHTLTLWSTSTGRLRCKKCGAIFERDDGRIVGASRPDINYIIDRTQGKKIENIEGIKKIESEIDACNTKNGAHCISCENTRIEPNGNVDNHRVLTEYDKCPKCKTNTLGPWGQAYGGRLRCSDCGNIYEKKTGELVGLSTPDIKKQITSSSHSIKKNYTCPRCGSKNTTLSRNGCYIKCFACNRLFLKNDSNSKQKEGVAHTNESGIVKNIKPNKQTKQKNRSTNTRILLQSNKKNPVNSSARRCSACGGRLSADGFCFECSR